MESLLSWERKQLVENKMKMQVQYAGLCCALVAAVIHLNTLDCGFCFDDSSAIEQNQDLRATSPWSSLLWNDFWGTPMHIEGSHKSYRPLCVATFRLNYLLHELQPMGYHLVNVLLHSAVCYLYVQLCGVVFSEVWPALIAGLLFALHPIHTEAVAGVVGRAETLSALFFILTILCYRRATHCTSGKCYVWFGMSLLMCFCSVLSKEQGITAIAVCVAYDLVIAQKLSLPVVLKTLGSLEGKQQQKQQPPSLSLLSLLPRPLRKVLSRGVRQAVGRGCVLVVFLAGVMVLRVQIMKAELPVFTVHDNPAVALATPYRQLHWLHLCFVNFWLLLSPSFLCADWTMGTVPLITTATDPRNLATLLAFTALFVMGFYSICGESKRAKAVFLALSLVVFPYIPASNLFFPVGFVVAERILYVPSMGFDMLVALGVWVLLKERARFTKFLTSFGLVFLLLSHGVKSGVRNRDWYSDKTLFESAVRTNPQNGKIYSNLGHEYEEKGNLSFAELLFHRASVIQPDDIGAYINLGRVLKAMERYTEAEDAYKVAVELMPKGKSFRVAPSHINVYYNLANLIKVYPNRLSEAYELYQKAISMKPNFYEAHMNKGDVLLKMNRTGDAKASFEMALFHNPDYADAHYNLATAYLQLGDKLEAERSYRQTLRLDAGHMYAMLGLSALLQEAGQPQHLEEAMKLLEHAHLRDPNNTRVLFNLAMIHLELQDMQTAEETFLKTLEIDPTYRSALFNLGVLHHHFERYDQAIVYFTRLKQHHPDHLNGAQMLGDCYMFLKDASKAAELYQFVLEQNRKHITSLHNLGVVRAGQGDFSAAIALFSEVLEHQPSHEAAKKHLQAAKLQLARREGGNGTQQEKQHNTTSGSKK